jgi:hypothetical protein
MALGNMNDVLDRVRVLLDQGNPQEALAVLSPHVRSGSKLIANAYAVCLMRLRQYDEAAKRLRELVYQGSSLAMAPDLPVIVKVNFATALLLAHNVDGAQSILNQLDEDEDKATAKLKAAISRWRKSLTFFQRVQCLWSTPSKPVSIDFPPGEV